MQNKYDVPQYNLLSTTLNYNLEKKWEEWKLLLVFLSKKPTEKYLHYLLICYSLRVAKLLNDSSSILYGEAFIFVLWLERISSFQFPDFPYFLKIGIIVTREINYTK